MGLQMKPARRRPLEVGYSERIRCAPHFKRGILTVGAERQQVNTEGVKSVLRIYGPQGLGP